MADRSHATYQDGRKPPERVPKSERILNLISVLLHADEPVPVTDILGKVTGYDDSATRESLMRRFERDKKVLRDIGIPIEHAAPSAFKQEGYKISRKDYFLHELTLPPASGQLLRALYTWAHADGGELSADLRSALVKLGFLFDADAHGTPVPATEALESQRPKNLEVLSEAVLRQKRVTFRYHSFGRDEEYDVEVDPYGIGFADQAWHRPAWYLVGYSHRKAAQGRRVFKLQRIKKEVRFVRPKGEGGEYEIPPGFRVQEHLGKTRFEWVDQAAPGADEAAERFTARVGFDPAVVSEVRAHVPGARSLGLSDGREVLEFEVHARRAFLRFLLRYVPRLRVLDPPELAPELRDLAREVLARYQAGA